MALVVQAGHVNIEQNCNEGLRSETGAPGEREYVSGIAATVAGALQAHGPVVIVADANFNCSNEATSTDYSAVIALHCDGRSTSGFSCNVGNPTEDGAAAQSQKLQEAVSSAYAAETGLKDLSGEFVSDANISEYYLFEALTPNTPFVLLELGAIASSDGSPGPDRDYLLSHTHEVADAIVSGVLDFMGVKQQVPTPAEAPAEGGPAPEVPNAPAPVQPNPTTPPVLNPTGTAVLTNLGQAIAYEEGLYNAVKTWYDTGDLSDVTAWYKTFEAVIQELHTARKLLGGE